MDSDAYGLALGNQLQRVGESAASYLLMNERQKLAEMQEGRQQRELSLRERSYERDDEMHRSESSLANLVAQQNIKSLRNREELSPYLVDFNNQMDSAESQYQKTFDPSVYENVRIPEAVLNSNDPELISKLQGAKRARYTKATEDSLNVSEEGALTSLAMGINELIKDDPSKGLLASSKLKAVLGQRAEAQKATGVAVFDAQSVEIIGSLGQMVSENKSRKSQEALATKIIPEQYRAQRDVSYSENAATRESVLGASTEADNDIDIETNNLKRLAQDRSDRTKEMNATSSDTKKGLIKPQIEEIDKQMAQSRNILGQAVQAKRKIQEAAAKAYANNAGRNAQGVQGISSGYFENLPKVQIPKNIEAKKYSKKQEENLKAEITSGKYTKQDALTRMKKYGVVPSTDFADFLSK